MSDHEKLLDVAQRWERLAAELRAENARLEAENNALRFAYNSEHRLVDEARAELAASLNVTREIADEDEAEIVALRAENEALRTRFSEAVVHGYEDGTASIEWTYRLGKQVLMSEELFIECVEKHNAVVALREALQALVDATDPRYQNIDMPFGDEITEARAAAVALLAKGEPQ